MGGEVLISPNLGQWYTSFTIAWGGTRGSVRRVHLALKGDGHGTREPGAGWGLGLELASFLTDTSLTWKNLYTNSHLGY